jgi:hypothetical protein
LNPLIIGLIVTSHDSLYTLEIEVAQTAVGTTASIWRYPVKSILGEELNSSNVSERGLVGDRAYALIDKETSKVASAKNPRKMGKAFLIVIQCSWKSHKLPRTFHLSGLHYQMVLRSSLVKVRILTALCQRFSVDRLDS